MLVSPRGYFHVRKLLKAEEFTFNWLLYMVWPCKNVDFCVGGVSDRLSYTSDQEIAIPSTPTSRQPPPQRRSRTLQDHDNSQRSVSLKNSFLLRAIFAAVLTILFRFRGCDAFAQPNRQQGYSPPPLSPPSAAPEADEFARDNDARQSRRKKKKKRRDPDAAAAPEATSSPVAAGEDDPEALYAKPKKKKHKRPKADREQAVAEPHQEQGGSPTLARINIHAQPGTSVLITPGGPQQHQPPTMYGHNTSRDRSTETAI